MMQLRKTIYYSVMKMIFVATILNHVCEGTSKHINITRHEKLLFEDLFRDYNKEIRPVLDQSHLMDVNFEVALSEILDLDEKNQVLTTNVWIRQNWSDELLKWNASHYGGITSINIDPIHVWKPDILLYNNVHIYDNGEQYLFKTKVIITNDGTVSWFSPNKLTTSCTIDIKYFPFDTQECKLTFGSWTYSGEKLLLHFLNNQSRRVDLTKFSKNGELDLVSAEGQLNKIVYPCCPDPYYDLTYTLVMRRRPLFYLNNLILPCIVLALLTGISFLFPPETGERISLVVTVLLGMTVFMIVFTDFIPASSEVTPLIGKYFITVLFEVAACLLATCVPLRLQHLHPGTEMPRWAKVLVFDYLAVVMCFRFRRRRKVSDHFPAQNNNNQNGIELGENDIERGEVDEYGIQSSETKQMEKGDCENGSLSDGISTVKKYVDKAEREGELYAEWKNAIAIIDRLFFWLFVVTFTTSSFTMLLIP